MSPRSLFIIILRVIGILFLKELLIAVPQLITSVLSYFQFSGGDGAVILFFSLLTVVLYLWISYNLIFKADRLVSMFALDKGFAEETFQLTISVSSILRIAIIVTGAVILITNIPEFCQTMYISLTGQRRSLFETAPVDWSLAIYSAVKIIIGLLLIGERKRISAFLDRLAKQEKDQAI